MSAARSQLERNVARLLQHAWVRAPARPWLRARVLAALEPELARLAGLRGAGPRVQRPRPFALPTWSLVAAAALLLFSGYWIGQRLWRSAPGPVSAPEELVTGPPTAPGDSPHESGTGSYQGHERLAEVPRAPQPLEAGSTGAQRSPVDSPGPEEATPKAALSPETRPGLWGRVLDLELGTPVQSFELILWREQDLPEVGEPSLHRFEQPDGRFELDELEPGHWQLRARSAQHATCRVGRFEIEAGALREQLQIQLESGASARGRLRDAASGLPIEGAFVLSETDAETTTLPCDPLHLPADLLRCARSAADGSFELTHLSSGVQRLRVLHADYAPALSEPLSVARGAGASGVLIELRPGGGFTGRVTRADGSAWEGALILTSSTPAPAQPMLYTLAFADAQGRYTLRHVPPGLYAVLHLPREGEPGQGGALAFQLGMAREGALTTIDFLGRTEARTRLIGHVIDARGKPVPDLSLSLTRAGADSAEDVRGASVAKEGGYAFDGLEPGRYVLFAGTKMGMALSECAEILVPGAPVQSEMRCDVQLVDGSISGSVRAAPGGSGISAALVLESIEDSPYDCRFAGRILTASDGSYELDFVRPGRYRLTAYDLSGGRGQEALEPIELAWGEQRKAADFALAPGGSLHVLVQDEQGQPRAGARVRLRDATDREVGFAQVQRTDEHGRFDVSGMKPGHWTIEAEFGLLRAGPDSLEIQVNATPSAILTLFHP